ncbi:hypothetical protein GCM10022251_65920 [Phytohabitans flavus]
MRAARIRTVFYHGVVSGCQGWHGNCSFDISPMASGPAEPGETPWAMDTTGWWHNAFLLLYLLQQFAVENVLPSERDTLIELAVRPRKGTARKGLCEILQMTGREAFLDPGHGARVRDAARSTPR